MSLDKLGVSGKNAMIMIGLLAAGLKGYSMITTFANSQLGINLGLKKSGLLVDALTIMKGKEKRR